MARLPWAQGRPWTVSKIKRECPVRAIVSLSASSIFEGAIKEGETMKILLVQCEAAAELLKQWKHTVLTADSAAAAIERVAARKPDAVLIDLSKTNSIKLARQLRLSGTARMPLIGVTEFMDVDQRRQAIDAGIDGFLAHPFKPEELAEMLGRFHLQRGETKRDVSKAIAEKTRVAGQLTREVKRIKRERVH
jgi:CheY-like chemotaxis protein